MKQIILIIGILIVITMAYFFINNKTEVDQNPVTINVSGEIVDVTLDQIAFDGPALIKVLSLEGSLVTIAVPSMGIQSCVAKENITEVEKAAVGDKVTVSGYLNKDGNVVPCDDEAHYLHITGFVGDPVYGYEFAYKKGPDGYIVLEDNSSSDPDLVSSRTLINQLEYEALKASTEAHDGPMAIYLRIYSNPENLQASAWALQKPTESNIEIAKDEPKEVLVGGVDAIQYTVDGLYLIDTYIITSGKFVYVLAGSYLDKESVIHEDFNNLISSFTLTQTTNTAPLGKINPRVPCEGALAYMTFTSGIEADAFVEACVAGEHPEVIERYIKDLELDETVI